MADESVLPADSAERPLLAGQPERQDSRRIPLPVPKDYGWSSPLGFLISLTPILGKVGWVPESVANRLQIAVLAVYFLDLHLHSMPGIRFFHADDQGVRVGWFRPFRARWEELRLVGSKSGAWELHNGLGRRWYLPEYASSELLTVLLSRLSRSQIEGSGHLERRFLALRGTECIRLKTPGYFVSAAAWFVSSGLIVSGLTVYLWNTTPASGVSWLLLAVYMVAVVQRGAPLVRRFWKDRIELDEEGITAKIDGFERRVLWRRVMLYSNTIAQKWCSAVIADDQGVIQLNFDVRTQPDLLRRLQMGVEQSLHPEVIIALPEAQGGP